MDKTSTPLTTNSLPSLKSVNTRQRKSQSLSPRRSTILMLKQFARSYSSIQTLPIVIGSIVAN
jgi:hypothetical protein